jgi:hypothetical protein
MLHFLWRLPWISQLVVVKMGHSSPAKHNSVYTWTKLLNQLYYVNAVDPEPLFWPKGRRFEYRLSPHYI